MSVTNGAFLTATKTGTFVFNKAACEMLNYYRPKAQALVALVVSDGRAVWLKPVVDSDGPRAIPTTRIEHAPLRFPGRIRTQFRYAGFRDGIGAYHGRLPTVWDRRREAFWVTVPLPRRMMVPLHTVPMGSSIPISEYKPLPSTREQKGIYSLLYEPWTRAVHGPLLTKDGHVYRINIAATHILRRYAPRTTALLAFWSAHTLWLQPVCRPQHENAYLLTWGYRDGIPLNERGAWKARRWGTFSAAPLTHSIHLPNRSPMTWDGHLRAFRIDLAIDQTPRFVCPNTLFAVEDVG